MTAKSRPVMIMAGGTGGHVYPALAVARALLAEQVPVVWLGTRKGLEAKVVPEAGITIEWLSISGLRGKGVLTLLLAPLRLLYACLQVALIMLRVKPRLVLGMGGFVAGPGGIICKLLHIPLVIHEQNAIAGLTNRILSSVANSVLQAFPDTFKHSKHAYHTGNPVRADIINVTEPVARLENREGRLRLLIIGGSLGAHFLNEVVPQAIATMPVAIWPQIRHQAGRGQYDATVARYESLGVDADVTEFVDDMAEAYTWADLVICRAGAMTVSELAAVGLGSVLVPFPYAVDDHQTANARYLSEHGAAILAPQATLTVEQLGDWLSELSVDRQRLIKMASKARELAKPEATQFVLRECQAVAGAI